MNLLLTYGNIKLNLFLISTFLFLIISLGFYTAQKEKPALLFLLMAGFCFYCFAALLDPFLNIWDERFHALVAKNLMSHPLKPTLYDNPIVKMDYNWWDRYHIWLHKQPLFLWQIALSFKIFGISEFSLRIPSIISGVILIYIAYRIGTLLINSNVGYITGIFLISTYYIFELISGRQAIDHNDISFLFYVSLSIWAFIEYYYSKKKYWIFLIGLFSGMAILCKWLVGMLIYFGWFVLKLLQKKFKLPMYKDLLISLLVTLLIAAPWQVFTFIAYPDEAAQAYEINVLHFIKALDGHAGTLVFYFKNFDTIYGRLASVLIIPAFMIMYIRINDKKLFYVLTGMVLIVYTFFTIATTKMLSFPIVVLVIILFCLASLFDSFLLLTKNLIFNKIIRSIIHISLIILILSRFDFALLKERHMAWNTENSYNNMLLHNKKIFASLELPENAVLFNVKGRHFIEAMFYTGKPAYNFIPTQVQYNDLKSKKSKIYIFRPSINEIPEYLKKDTSVEFIDRELRGYE